MWWCEISSSKSSLGNCRETSCQMICTLLWEIPLHACIGVLKKPLDGEFEHILTALCTLSGLVHCFHSTSHSHVCFWKTEAIFWMLFLLAKTVSMSFPISAPLWYIWCFWLRLSMTSKLLPNGPFWPSIQSCSSDMLWAFVKRLPLYVSWLPFFF